MMLAFVFWHWPFPEVDTERYEARLARFHEALPQAKPQGFSRSVVFRIDGAPWTAERDRAYEDWYLLDDSAAIDALNEAAVSGDRKGPHDNAAESAAGGTGGLYQLKEGVPNVVDCRHALWLAKPRSSNYEDFYSQLRPWTEQPGASLWRRHLVLGPTPEFCLLAPDEPKTFSGEGASPIRLDIIWP